VGLPPFPGTDWVHWEDSEGEVVAAKVHPLYRYKAFPKQKIREGDRLRKINYFDIPNADAAKRLLEASPQGKTFIYQISPPGAAAEASFETRRVRAGFRLPFMAQELSGWWRLQAWLAGLLLVVSLMVALILFPIVKKRLLRYAGLLAVVGMAMLVSGWQSLHALYLVLESDLVETGMASWTAVVIAAGLPLYGFAFLLSKKTVPRWMRLGGALLPIVCIFWTYSWLNNPESVYKFPWLMNAVTGTFWLLLAGGLGLDISQNRRLELTTWIKLGLLVMVIILWAQSWQGDRFLEYNLIALHFLLYAPLLDAAQNELRFGKVSLVVTRALQAVAFVAFSLLGYFLINSLLSALLPASPYRPLIDVLILLLALLAGRWLYRANQRRINTYFTTTQQNKLEDFREFLASIPRYTNEATLKQDITKRLASFFEAESAWWQPEGAAVWEHAFRDELSEKRNFWADSPELGGLRPTPELQARLAQWPWVLALPLSAEDPEADMLLLAQKRRGVYNLSDLDLLFQLARQTHLTLNVLALMNRERDLMQRNYEANLTVLRAQINPHFLFNTLNTISALIHDAPDLAEEAVEHLAFIFRYTLDHSGDRFVQLRQELSLVSTYLEVEKIRFGERLLVSIDTEKEALDTYLPALVIQTLIENCIKHGIAKIIGQGVVSIDAYVEDDMTIIEVYDNGPGIDMDRIDKGTGLNNVITRLSHIYQNKNSLYFENTGQGTRAILRIPRQKPSEQSHTT
jgi:signal transduction histidine kinase